MNHRGRIILGVSLTLVLCALAIGILGPVASQLQSSRTISNLGSMKGVGVGVYWDPACTNKTSSIGWGFLEPGSNKTATVYVKNEGNAPTILSKVIQNWNPQAASSYMTMDWNYSGQTLNVNQVLQVKLTLTVSQSISGITNFSFDITITATG